MNSEQLTQTFLCQLVAPGRHKIIDEIANEHMIDEANLAFGGPNGRDGTTGIHCVR